MLEIFVCTILIVLFIFLAFKYFHMHFYSWCVKLPRPKYRYIIEKNVQVSMQDGIKLSTDIYRPKSHQKHPVVIARTPYNKNDSVHPYKQLGKLFASQGYVLIVQDVRGKHSSEGDFKPYANESADGYATVEWAGKAPWSNGRVALFGYSYLGSCAWLAAASKSPYLKTILPMFTTHDAYSIFIDEGIFYLKGTLYWLSKYSDKHDSSFVNHEKIRDILWKLPVDQLDEMAIHHHIKTYQECLDHLTPSTFWEKTGAAHLINGLNIPAYILGGWYDPYLPGTIKDFQRMIHSPEGSKNRQSHLVVGPWSHNPAQRFKGVNFEKRNHFNFQLCRILEWCEKWLTKDEEDYKKTELNRVDYFIMGRNEWKQSPSWPPENITYTKYYLSANNEDKLLSLNPTPEISTIQYNYNPLNPVLFKGSYILNGDGWIGPIEQSEITSRKDVITFTSKRLEKEVVIAGPITLVLFVSSTALDTDFCAKICDVRPDGKSYNLQSGMLRMRYRSSFTKPELMTPGEIYQIEISLRTVANAFLKNHRIQLQITSSDFPVHDRNLNTGLSCEHTTETVNATQTLFMGGIYGSYLLLPEITD